VHLPPPRRLQTFSYIGRHAYSLRFCTQDRRAVFVDHLVVDLVLSQFVLAARDTGIAILAYCFMPDHVHLVVAGTAEDADARAFIIRAKQLSGFVYGHANGVRLWQRYSYERVLRADESCDTVMRYVLENPVREGLVSRAHDYPFSGSCLHPLRDLLASLAE
jgi:putative transposase